VAAAPLKPCVAVAVVTGPQFVVGEHLECPGRLLEAVGRLGVAGVLVRMELDRQLAICVGDLRAAGAAFHSQNFVVIALVGHAQAVQTQTEASRKRPGTAFSADG
jgi:hypothetical protein